MAEPTPEKQKELQKKFMEYQVLEQQMKQLQQQLEKMEQQTAELDKVKDSVSEIAEAKPGEEVLVPISGGIFFKTTLQDSTQFLVNVGGGVVVHKDAAGTKGLLDEQAKEIAIYKMHIAQQLENSAHEYQKLEDELKKLIED